MLKTPILIMIYVFFQNTSVLAQEKVITNKTIRTFFSHLKYNSRHFMGEVFINNVDSSYYKQRKIELFNAKYPDSCEYVTWRFLRKNRFELSEGELCKEPPTMRFLKNPFRDIKIRKKHKQYYLFISSNNDKEVFLINRIYTLNFGKKESTDVMDLTRQ